ncbi:helix-turn-helix transcriptional regulator [Sinorhizobium meliloti]|uniref:helix-turn-helix transcriptional regulator n=1 Tax=Rhizobium meliloti TaxID=382 RepID=UPI000FDA42F5|nr:helix-turn-helix transcriptional regulator [Sinorhizobium meliloti]RVG01811.1 helix-turn-helix transcriptional regulator [Sinorhizobium meliloti]
MGAAFDLESICSAFADAALDPALWGTAMEAVSEATRSYGAMLFDANGHLPGIPRSRSVGPSFDAYVRDGWIHRDIRYRIAPVLHQRGAGVDLDIISDAEMARHPYYQDFLAPFGLRWFAGVKVAAGDDFWCLSIQRTIQQGPFDRRELIELAELSQRLGPAAAFASAIGYARSEAACDAFMATGTPTAMLGRDGTVVCINGPAEGLLDQDLRIVSGRLVSGSRNSTDAFDRSLNELLRSPASAAMMPPVQMSRVHSGRRPLLAYLLRLPKVTHNSLSPCQAAAVFIDPDVRAKPAEAVLMSCFGLTRAEAKLAGMLAGGDCLLAVAEHLCITYETARNQLKAVFAKTETHRQSDLLALLSRLQVGTP